ncbi:MAG: V-type ATP synthase subunit E [Planctomycetota bacterium]|jgi:V/A-type H+-transporting ATPase subunit E
MDAEQVIKKILSEANNEAAKIKAEADEKQAAEQTKLAQQLSEYKKQSGILAKKAAEEKKEHLLAAARMDIAKEYLAAKGKMLDEVFEKAREQMQNLRDDEYIQHMTKRMLDAVETGDEEIIVDKNEKRIDQEFIKNINRELGPGFKGNLRLADEKQNLGAGFILRRGKIKTNLSLDVLLERARKELEIELAKELFEN